MITSKKISRIPLPKAIKKLDYWFELYIRYRDNWKCIVCDTTMWLDATHMHAGHLIRRTHKKTRWDEINVHAQCYKCNCAHNFDESAYTAKFLQRYGQQAYIDLVARAKGTDKLNSAEVIERAQYYKSKVDEYTLQYGLDNRRAKSVQ